MSNKEWYQKTFEQVQISEKMLREVETMSTEKKNRKQEYMRFVAAAAALLVVFLVGNGVSYAATGESILGHVTILLDGKKVDEGKLRKTKGKDGKDVYVYHVDSDADVELQIDTDYMEKEGLGVQVDMENETVGIQGMQVTFLSGEVKKMDNQIYLIIGENEKQIDITDDFQDGKAEGEFQISGTDYTYTVTGTVEEAKVSIYEK